MHTTLGLNGGCIFLAVNLGHLRIAKKTSEQETTHRFQSIYLAKNECFLISSPPFAPNLLVGSRCSRPVITCRASGEISAGNVSGSVRIR
jgi:hypothetical protein